MKKKMISILFAVMLAFLLVTEGVISVQAADTPTQYYNIQFQIVDTPNNVYTYCALAPTVIQQPPWKLNGTGPYISNAVGYQIGAQQDFEFDVMGICRDVVATSNTNQACFSVSGNHVSMQIMGPIIPGSTIYIVISGKHEPIANSITTQPATCTTEGREIATCSKCYRQYVYRILPVDPNRHGGKSIKKIDKDATCTEAGQYHYECEKCGTTTIGKQTIPAKGHTWTDSGSGLVCSVCGKKSEAKASGMYYGIPWEMDAEGNLTLIGGTCTDIKGTKWNAAGVKTVKCNGEIICNDYFCQGGLFSGHSNLVSADLSGFDTSNVTDMRYMFFRCENLTSLDVSNFNTSNVTDMKQMFYCCSELISLDLSNFNTSNVTNMASMFGGCEKLILINVSNFDTSKVIYMAAMFEDCHKLASLDVSNFNTSNVTSMGYMFHNCYRLTSLDLSNFDTSKVTDMLFMFATCYNLVSLDLSNFNTSNVTSMKSMFDCCSGLTSLNVSSFNTNNVTNMERMFYGCNKLEVLTTPKTIGTTNIDLPFTMYDDSNKSYSSLVGNSVVLYRKSFYYGIEWKLDAEGNLTLKGGTCTNTREPKWNAYNVKTVKCDGEIICNDNFCKELFKDHKNLVSVDLSGFNTNNVTCMNSMFYNCQSLTSLDLSNFDTSKVTSVDKMFSGNKLEILTTPKTVGAVNIDLPFTMYDKNGNEYNKITVTNTKLYKEPQFKIFVNKTVRIKGIAIGSRRIKVNY